MCLFLTPQWWRCSFKHAALCTLRKQYLWLDNNLLKWKGRNKRKKPCVRQLKDAQSTEAFGDGALRKSHSPQVVPDSSAVRWGWGRARWRPISGLWCSCAGHAPRGTGGRRAFGAAAAWRRRWPPSARPRWIAARCGAWWTGAAPPPASLWAGRGKCHLGGSHTAHPALKTRQLFLKQRARG